MNLSQTDSILLAVPFVTMLAMFVFRLDVVLFRSPAKQEAHRGHRPRFANFDPKGAMADPDGRVPQPSRGKRR